MPKKHVLSLAIDSRTKYSIMLSNIYKKEVLIEFKANDKNFFVVKSRVA